MDQLEALFKECDINGDGVVDFEEFRRVMDLLSGQVRVRVRVRARARARARVRLGFRRVMDLLYRASHRASPPPRPPRPQTGKKYNYLQLKAMFRLADLDNSGSIDFNEFLHAQRRAEKDLEP